MTSTVRRQPPPPGEVHVWRVDLDAAGPGVEASLSDDERRRAAQFIDRRHQARFAACRAALRAILAGYLDACAEALRFHAGPHGKPALEGVRQIDFNLSHSAGLALVAVSAGARLGVDVEAVVPHRDFEAIAERFFAPSERDALLAHHGAARVQAFYDVWTRKEAYIKAIGLGLAMPLDRFVVSADPDRAVLLEQRDDPTEVERWSMGVLAVEEGYRAALCLEGRLVRVTRLTWRGVG